MPGQSGAVTAGDVRYPQAPIFHVYQYGHRLIFLVLSKSLGGGMSK
jgi:hypothetical protein